MVFLGGFSQCSQLFSDLNKSPAHFFRSLSRFLRNLSRFLGDRAGRISNFPRIFGNPAHTLRFLPKPLNNLPLRFEVFSLAFRCLPVVFVEPAIHFLAAPVFLAGITEMLSAFPACLGGFPACLGAFAFFLSGFLRLSRWLGSGVLRVGRCIQCALLLMDVIYHTRGAISQARIQAKGMLRIEIRGSEIPCPADSLINEGCLRHGGRLALLLKFASPSAEIQGRAGGSGRRRCPVD